MTERLQKIISAHGAASRREAERLISAGRVTVNGRVATLGESADAAVDAIALDGVPLREPDDKVYIMLNKPRGVVTTLRDEQGRHTVAEYVSACGARVYPVGRLDMDSDGLLLMTNDGDLANRLMHPSHETRKTYHVYVEGEPAKINAAVQSLSQPMEIEGYTIRGAEVKSLRATANGVLLEITIHEGRNRQIRRMCELCDLRVTRLTRVNEGGIALGNLRAGQWRPLTNEEVAKLRGQ
ncbi:MAG: rRNA pseudouridine synthase [Oscillospiraceae bacterium]|jgi:23S rRNA pseudouridine2605 synthase|nr:rRNA pseudouridine synthase [Oscillospiraceae bacterium]